MGVFDFRDGNHNAFHLHVLPLRGLKAEHWFQFCAYYAECCAFLYNRTGSAYNP